MLLLKLAWVIQEMMVMHVVNKLYFAEITVKIMQSWIVYNSSEHESYQNKQKNAALLSLTCLSMMQQTKIPFVNK